jgi:hypothetical protein
VRQFVFLPLLLLWACHPDEKKEVTAPSVEQCGKDTDCKGDRVCDGGKCVSPALSAAVDNVSAAASTASVLPVCKPNDGKTRIPVWTPTIDGDGNLSSDPPQKDGQIVYIEMFADADKAICNDSELNSFSRPADLKDPMQGGLAVNFRGNTQFANGTCYFRGYYMNEDVMGMHQGWIETYFKAVDKEKIILSDKFCLSRPIP